MDFPVGLFRQIVKNKDDSTGTLYGVCSDLWCDGNELKMIHQKRWKGEAVRKTLKSNASMAKSPSHTVRTQSRPIFLSYFSQSTQPSGWKKMGITPVWMFGRELKNQLSTGGMD